MSELKEFKLSDVGEGLTEADIVRWHVQPGDKITVNQVIVEIETAKAVVELPSPYEGVVADLLVPEGATADVGTPIISVSVGPGEPPTPRPVSEIEDLVPPRPEGAVEPGIIGSPAPKAERQAVLVGYGVKLGTTTRRPRKPAAGRGGRTPVPPTGDVEPVRPAVPIERDAGPARPAGNGRVLAKPPVRKLARDLGVELGGLTGTGPEGSITRDDVELAAATVGGADHVTERIPAIGTAAASGALPREERIPIRGVRKHTAAAVAGSAFTAPHVTEFLEIDITETMAATERLRALGEFADVRVSPLLLVSRALIVAAARNPMINSSWDEAAQEIVVKRYVNLGIAAATERGLVVPNVKEAHSLGLPDLARALQRLADTARAGRATPADLTGGTITITNVGVFGVDSGTPIITPGEAAILAFGRVREAPWVVGGQLAVRHVCTLALSFDHRIVDGDLGSAVLRDVGTMLTDPVTMLAWS